MTSSIVYANFEPIEGVTTGSDETLTFVRRSRKVVITNDHPTNALQYKFNSSESFGTLRPTETLSLGITAKQIILNGNSVSYRVWVFG